MNALKLVNVGVLPLLMIILSYSNIAYSCFLPPEDQRVPYCKLIERTANIVYARAIKVKKNITPHISYKYEFKILETLKGKNTEKFVSIIGWPPVVIDAKLDDHTKKRFWRDGWGRTHAFTDCKIYPDFELNKNYLLFIDKPYHRKSFEAIKAKNDSWFIEVKKGLKNNCKERKS